jgi:Transposase IS116/IS110/IS902 family
VRIKNLQIADDATDLLIRRDGRIVTVEVLQKTGDIEILQSGYPPKWSKGTGLRADHRNPERFKRGKQIGSYVGLIPSGDSSAGHAIEDRVESTGLRPRVTRAEGSSLFAHLGHQSSERLGFARLTGVSAHSQDRDPVAATNGDRRGELNGWPAGSGLRWHWLCLPSAAPLFW